MDDSRKQEAVQKTLDSKRMPHDSQIFEKFRTGKKLICNDIKQISGFIYFILFYFILFYFY